jgi:ribonuclease P protein subunit POP4
LTTSTPFIPEYVQSSLTQSSDPVGIYSSRVKGRQIILENPVRESKAKKERDGKRARRAAEREKRKVSIMGRREASDKGIWKLDKEQAKYVVGTAIF